VDFAADEESRRSLVPSAVFRGAACVLPPNLDRGRVSEALRAVAGVLEKLTPHISSVGTTAPR